MGRFSFLVKWHLLHEPSKLLILLCILVLAQGDAAWGTDSDKSALMDLKSSLSDPYGVLSSWNLKNSDHCSWVGVSCDVDSRVIALNVTGGGNNSSSCARITQFPLYGFGIRRSCIGNNGKGKVLGTISASVAKLSELKILSMPFNEISGEIPSEIWGMEKLEVIDLEGNSISGSLPSQFVKLKNLKVLNLGFNEIFGIIPSSLSNCVGLQVMNLAGNHFNGSIPEFVSRFSDLRGLYLSFNLLSGSIPNEIGNNCGKLEHLELSANYLTEGIPKSLGNCKGLKTLLLYSNMLEEVIPSELGDLTQLEVLDVSRNNFGGPIPPELGNCTKLSILVLSNLWDPLPDVAREKFASSPEEFNFYEGTVPPEITSLMSLKMVWAPRATLEGNLPSRWESCASLEMLNLAQNYYSGKISEGFSNCKKLRFLDLSSNKLFGEINVKVPVPCMTFFDVSGNYLSGSIPKFDSEACSPVQSTNGNFFEAYDDLSVLYMSYFGYRTQIQTSLPLFKNSGGMLPALHNFSFNNLTGPLPSMPIARFGKQIVYAFLAGSNKLSGTFPGNLFENFGQVGGLMINVSNNELSGQVPADFFSSGTNSLMLLDISSNQLTGILPPGIGNMVSSLDVLNLSRNNLEGLIPESIGQIKDLKCLSLAGNKFDGPIPASLGQLNSLEVLDLSSNSLCGEIPNEFVNLRNLTALFLNNNNLSGQIPSDLANVSTLALFNASFNNLSGALPLKDKMIKCDSFIGNPYLHCTGISLSSANSQGRIESSDNDTSSSPYPPSGTRRNGNLNSIEIASITSATAIVSVLLALIVLFIYTRKWRPGSRVSGSSRKEVIVFNDIGVPLTFENVVRATGNFNASNCIGNGGFGATFKAEIAPGVIVAIKRLAVGRFQGVVQFDAEIKTLGRLRHPNLVTLIGYHASETEMFLIYNYLPGGNLERFIHERSTRAVDWRVLHKISLDIARALAYLHDTCVPRVLHRDVKPSNILLDEDYNAYLSDFGLARLLGTSETHATTGVAGTFGYVAPEYAMTCRVSDKADVYSYGVVVLELLSDKKALDPSFSSYGNGFNIVAWAHMLLREGRAKEVFTAGLWDSGPHDDLVDILHLAVVCTVEVLSTRPTMKMVVKRLKQLQPPSC